MKAAVTILLAAGLLTISACGGGQSDPPMAGYPQWMRSETDRGQTRLSAPLIALNCPVGNAFRCDRIVFSYALRLPARRLEAWVAGRRVTGLRTAPYGGDGTRHGEAGLTWTGHVQPAGLTEPGAPLQIDPPRPDYWAGVPPVRARVLVVAKLKSGETVREIFPFVRLQAGYG